MNEYESVSEQEENLKKDVVKFASYQAFVGLSSSVINALIQLLLKKQWSLALLINMLIPFFAFCIVYFIISIYMKSKQNTTIPLFNNKVKLISVLLFFLFIVFNLSIWYFNKPNEMQSVNIQYLDSLNNDLSGEDNYFVVFSSQNCTYCHQMEPIFTKAYTEHPDIKFYYCDISFESTTNSAITNRNITKLPLLVCYQQGKEVDRIEGVATIETVNEFLKKVEG